MLILNSFDLSLLRFPFGNHKFVFHVCESISFFYKFIYLFLAALGLRCCAQAFYSCSEGGLLFVEVHGLLVAVASFLPEHGL